MAFARRTTVLAALLVVLWSVGGAEAATSTGIATWTFSGSAGAFSGTTSLPGLGFPATTFTSDSRSTSSIGIQTGQSMWFGPATPPGQVFGSSQNRPYLNLGAKSDGGAGTASTTTFRFAAGTPGGWGFVLGDVDADKVTITATRADGSPAGVADLGFAGVFNMCQTSPKPSGCGTDSDVPTWNATTGTLIGAGVDTVGAAGWFRPTVSLGSLTFRFVKQTGFPTYQTWFAERMQDLSGRVAVADGTCDVTTAQVALVSPDGRVVGTTTPATDGSYAFARVAASAGFTVRLDAVPAGCRPVGATSQAVDLSTGDQTAGFAVEAIPETRIAGRVVDTEQHPVAGVVLTTERPDGTMERAHTDADGRFELPALPPGTYPVTVHPPPSYVVEGAATHDVTIAADGTASPAHFVLRHRTTVAATPTTTTSTATPVVATGVLPTVGNQVPAWLAPLGVGLVLAGLGTVRWSGRRSRRRSRPARV